MPKRDLRRADELLVERGLAETRSKARAYILAGEVRVGPDHVVTKAGEQLPVDADLRLDERPRFVSRGGDKLAHALEVFDIDPTGVIAADFGASTGGFTDCLLQHGARRVYAIDVGYGQLDYRLRQDDRVIVMERTNVRYLESLPEQIDIVTIDVSFISLSLVLEAATNVLSGLGTVIALIKPQFEAGKGGVNRRGVVTDQAVRRQAIVDVVNAARDAGLTLRGVTQSPVVGPAGNIEYLALFGRGTASIKLDPVLDDLFAGVR